MKLYYSKGTCSLSVRITMNELGIDSEFVHVNFRTKKLRDGSDFYKINPKGAVPVLELGDGSLLTENIAIQLYLTNLKPNNSMLISNDNPSYYRYIEMLSYISTEIHKSCVPIVMEKVPEQLKESFFRPYLGIKLKYIDDILGQNQYLIADKFSAADSYLFVILSWMPYLGMDLSRLSNLEKYYNNLKQLDSIKKSLEDEHIV